MDSILVVYPKEHLRHLTFFITLVQNKLWPRVEFPDAAKADVSGPAQLAGFRVQNVPGFIVKLIDL